VPGKNLVGSDEPSDTAVPIVFHRSINEGPIRRTREGGVNGSR
jgi:hypothetical protein